MIKEIVSINPLLILIPLTLFYAKLEGSNNLTISEKEK